MNLLAQTALLVSLTSLAMALSVMTRQLQNKLVLSFSAVCGGVFLWSLFFFLEKVFGGGRFYFFHLLSGIWLGPVCLFFIRVWIGRFPRGWISAVSHGLWILTLVSSLALTVAWALSINHGIVSSQLLRDIMYFSPTPVVLQLLVIFATRRPLPLREGVVFGGALVVLALSTMDHVPWLGHVLPSIGNLLLSVYLILLGQAIRQQKFLDLPLLVTRFLVLLVLAFILTGLYLLLVAWVEKNPVLFFLNSFAVSFLVVMLLNPLQRWVSALTDRLLASRDADWLKRLEQSKLELRSANDLESWEIALRSGLEQAVAPDGMKIVLLDRDFSERPPLLLEESQTRRKSGRVSILVSPLLSAEIDRTANASVRTRLEALLGELSRHGFSAFFPIADTETRGWIFLKLEAELSPHRGIGSWRQLRDVEEYLAEAARTLALLRRVRDEAERERLVTLGEMAAGLAHEIRNPLGAIQGAAQLLPESSEFGPWTRVIREEVARLNHVVSQFLLYSRKASPETSPVEVSSWLARAIERLNSSLTLSQASAKVLLQRCDPGLSVDMDAEAIFQVVENLVRNSVQAKAEKIVVQAMSSAEEKSVIIELSDDGHGIDSADFDKLFVPFFTTSNTGTGLGLSISQRIIEGHHGKIEAVRHQSRGACFRIWLPRRNST